MRQTPIQQEQQDMLLREIWFDYKSGNKDRETDLVERYSWLAHDVAGRKQVPDYVEREELLSWAFQGLLDAIRKYDPTTCVNGKFHTHFLGYARVRTSGAVLDGLKSPGVSWASRGQWRLLKEQREAEETLFQELGRQPSQQEIKEHVGRDLLSRRQQIPFCSIISSDDENSEVYRSAFSSDAPDEDAFIGMAAERVAAAICRLPQDEQELLVELHMKGAPITRLSKLRAGVRQVRANAFEHLLEELHK